MSIGESLRELGEFLDECENRESVTRVEMSGNSSTAGEDPLTSEIEVGLSTGSGDGVTVQESDLDPDGTLRLAVASPSSIVPLEDHDVDVDVTSATIEGDGSVTATLAASVTVGDGAASTETEESTATEPPQSSPELGHEGDLPPFRNPELLTEVYESCDTFAEMTDEIGMDVTAETVRRYMIDHGIHTPNSYDTSQESETTEAQRDAGEEADPGGAAADEPEAPGEVDSQRVYLADGIGLPDDVTVEELIDTVQRSNTILEVKEDLGLERQRAHEMLQKIDLLDFVVGRLSTESEREITREDIVARLREASQTA